MRQDNIKTNMNLISWKEEVCPMDELFASETQRVSCATCALYSDTSANEDNSLRNHIR